MFSRLACHRFALVDWRERSKCPLQVGFCLCSIASGPATQPFHNQVRRLARVEERRVDDQAGCGPSLVFTTQDSLPGWQSEARNVSTPTFHASAVFNCVRAHDFNLQQARRCAGCHSPPRFAGDREWIDAVGDHCHAKRKVGFGELVGKDVAGGVNFFKRAHNTLCRNVANTRSGSRVPVRSLREQSLAATRRGGTWSSSTRLPANGGSEGAADFRPWK